MGLAALGTFHERQGDQFLLNSYGKVPGGWMRVYGESFDQTWSSKIGQLDYELSPSFEGTLDGIQLGLDLAGILHDDESQDRFGLFFGYTSVSGDSIGHVLSRLNVRSGSIDMNGTSLGGYWTHIDPEGHYLDAVAMYTWLGGSVSSDLGVRTDVSGGAFLASLEGGYPVQLNQNWVIEPQAQIIWQHIDVDDTEDAFSRIGYDSFSSWTGRLGLRLEANTIVNDVPVQPFASLDLWHDFDGDYTVSFNNIPVVTNFEKTSLELSGGISAQFTEKFSAYGALHIATSLDDDDDQSFGGNIGLRIKW